MDGEETIYKKIKRLEDDLRGYKTAQPIGTDSVLAYTTQTNSIWDVSTTLPPNTLGIGNSSYAEYQIHFRARNQIAPFARIRVFAESPITLYYAALTGSYSTQTTLTISAFETTSYLNPAAAADPQLYRFTVHVEGPALTAYKLKFIVDATDYGQMTMYESTSNGLQVIA